VRLVCTAANPLEALMDATVLPTNTSDSHRMLMDDLKLTKTSATASIFTGEDELFAFRRTVSRLTEMRTEEYGGPSSFFLCRQDNSFTRKLTCRYWKLSVEKHKHRHHH
jgi:predicted ATPase